MGLRERFGLDETDPAASEARWFVPTPAPEVWFRRPSARLRIGLEQLGPAGFGLRDPDTGEALRVDEQKLSERGGVVTSLEGIAERSDDRRLRASAPGESLTLVPVGPRVAVHGASGELDVGYLDDALGVTVRDALRRGVELRAVSLWATETIDGLRTELKILIVPASVELVLLIGGEPTVELTEAASRTV